MGQDPVHPCVGVRPHHFHNLVIPGANELLQTRKSFWQNVVVIPNVADFVDAASKVWVVLEFVFDEVAENEMRIW